MTTPRIALPLLAALAIALASTIAWELRDPHDPPTPPGAPTPEPPAAANPAAPASQASEWAAALRARPPFSPDRRPPAPGAPTAAPPDPPLPRLAGIMVTPDGRSAIFAARPQPLVVREGGIVGRFSVQRIEPGQVTLAGPDGIRTLRPTFDAAAPGPRAQPGLSLPNLPLPNLPLPNLPLPGLSLPGLAQSPLTLPGARPVIGGDPPPIPGTSPALAEGPQDAMPFESIPQPSGMDIIRNQARRQPPAAGLDK